MKCNIRVKAWGKRTNTLNGSADDFQQAKMLADVLLKAFPNITVEILDFDENKKARYIVDNKEGE